MTLDELLTTCQREHIVLQPRGKHVSPWSAGQRIPRTTRTAIRMHAQALLQLIEDCEVRAGPSPWYHRAHWFYDASSRRFLCNACRQLRPFIEGSRSA